MAVDILERCNLELKSFLMKQHRSGSQKNELKKAMKELDGIKCMPKVLLGNIHKIMNEKTDVALSGIVIATFHQCIQFSENVNEIGF